MPADFTLREITVADGPAINALAANCPDAGLISVYSVFRDNAWQSLQALHPDTVGVLTEAPGHGGLAGVGLVGFTTRGIQGKAVPCALLNTLMVHPAYRRQGVAGGLSKWCIRHARSRFGENGVILADVQVGNRASHGTVRKWCNQMLPPITVAPVGLKTRGPGVLPGIRVGPVKRPALQEFTDRLNDFYKTYTFFKYETGHDLSAWLEERPFGLHTRHCLGARDPRGNLLAGLTLDEVHHLRTYHVARMPAWIRMANKLLHVVPRRRRSSANPGGPHLVSPGAGGGGPLPLANGSPPVAGARDVPHGIFGWSRSRCFRNQSETLVHQDHDADRGEDVHPHPGRSTDLSRLLVRNIWRI